jgi:hypothetical protein
MPFTGWSFSKAEGTETAMAFPPPPDLYGVQLVYTFLGIQYPVATFLEDAIPDPSISFLPVSAVALSRYLSGPFGAYDEVRLAKLSYIGSCPSHP